VRTFLLALATLALVLIAVCLAALTLEGWRFAKGVNEAADEAGGVAYLAAPSVDQLVDRLNESGYHHEPIDPTDPLLRTRTIVICEGMSERVARRVVEQLTYLEALDPKAPIELRIATSGGWIDSAFAIVDTMRAIRAPVNVTAFGGCYSAGTVILAAGTGTRRATPNALMSVHVNPYETGDEFEFDTRELARFRAVYRAFTDVPEVWFDQEGDNQWYFDARRALDMRLIDEIAEPVWKPAAVEEPRAARPAA
jgi:ATP-dependent Clp protease protease subunit